MKTTSVLCALLLMIAPASASQPKGAPDDYLKSVLADIGMLNNGLWVVADTSNRGDNSRHFRFTIIPNKYTASAMLEIFIDAPEGQNPEPVVYLFDHAGIEYPIADNVYQSGNQYFVYLPDLQAHRKVEFSLGLNNTGFSNYHVTALLTVDNGQQSAEWIGWKRREKGS